ncbi:MAG: hypothetical protein J7559_23690 [Cohnella sp.]|nr:hypothetical protein [Cohnella sp.]
MSYQEKKNIVQLISSTVIFALYSIFVYSRDKDMTLEGEELFRHWGAVILILIPITIVARMIIEIVFVIIHRIATNEKEPSFADELDKLIELKAMRVSYFVFLFGFFLAMGALVLEWRISAMFIILLVSGFVSEAAGILWKLRLYRRGV